MNAQVDVIGPKAEALGERVDRVSASVARLARSQAQLGVLTAAIADVRETVSSVHGRRPAQVTRVAAVDLGTNATRLLVADVEGARVEEIARRLELTRLGEGVDERRRLLPVPMARVRNVLTGYRRVAEELGAERVLAVATSSVREADNGEAFLGEIEWSYGFETLLLSGDEEAALTARGVSVGRELRGGVARPRRGRWLDGARGAGRRLQRQSRARLRPPHRALRRRRRRPAARGRGRARRARAGRGRRAGRHGRRRRRHGRDARGPPPRAAERGGRGRRRRRRPAGRGRSASSRDSRRCPSRGAAGFPASRRDAGP